jgi:DNA-binding response OmpR family regulator
VSESPQAFRYAFLVEDEPNLSEALQLAVKRLGIPRVEAASTLAEARAAFAAVSPQPDIVFLDRMLPDGEGLDLCRELRSGGFSGVILVLTASGLVPDRVQGLDAGADDYLPKPFSWEELAARVRALGRRRAAAPAAEKPIAKKNDVDADLWTLDRDRLRIFGPKGWAKLTPLEFKLVAKLIEAEDGRILSRDELLKDVWGFQWLPKTRTVDYFMGRVRKAFELDPEQPKHFLTVRGAGYRFER